jgi:hypothetical protein
VVHPKRQIKEDLKGDIGKTTSIIVEATFSILGRTTCSKK